MFHPLYDTSKLTEKELYEKIDEISVRIMAMRQMGMSYDIIEQAQTLLDALSLQLSDMQQIEDYKANQIAQFNMEDYLVDAGTKNKSDNGESDNILGW